MRYGDVGLGVGGWEMRYGDVGLGADVEEVGGAGGRCQVNECCGWGPGAGSGTGQEPGNGGDLRLLGCREKSEVSRVSQGHDFLSSGAGFFWG